jgi:hypothetical protein
MIEAGSHVMYICGYLKVICGSTEVFCSQALLSPAAPGSMVQLFSESVKTPHLTQTPPGMNMGQ